MYRLRKVTIEAPPHISETGNLEEDLKTPEIIGEIESITYRNEENGWSVLKLTPNGSDKTVTVVGHFAVIRAGEHVSMQGSWVEHKVHGKQFKCRLATSIQPTTKEGIIKYLSSGLIKGIGAITAKRIVKHFQEQTLQILNQNPERLTEIKSIGPAKARSIIKSWKESQEFRDAELFLLSHNLSMVLANKIIKIYRRHTVEIVSKEPYRLCRDITGVGFLTADKIAQSLGISPESQDRIAAAFLHVIRQAEEQGHCYLSTEQIIEKLVALLELDTATISSSIFEVIQDLNRGGAIVSESFSSTSIHYTFDLAVAEEAMAQKVRTLLARPIEVDERRIDSWLSRYSKLTHRSLSAKQLQAVKKAVSHRIFILTGGPGVGKTTTANAIINLLKAMNRAVALAAPTGRAAQRLSEVSQLEAKTVHRLLEWTPQDNGFIKNEANPLNAQAIVVDESSMLDIRLANALIQAISDNSQIIFIGDVDQLPSVGPGNVLRDLISSAKVPYIKLHEVFRQAAHSAIVDIAHKINSGIVPEFPDNPHCECRFIEAQTPQEICSTIKQLVGNILPQKGHYDPIEDIQVLTPMNRGELGTQQLNLELQSLLNPHDDIALESKIDHITFRPGDKVIQVNNNYELNVFNGDIGNVLHAGVSGGKVIVRFSGKNVTYSNEDAHDLKLAYAITIHKSQGSEFPVVLIPMSMQHFIMLQRNLIYTALTRAKKFAVFVGTRAALDHAIANQRSLDRQTNLIERINRHL